MNFFQITLDKVQKLLDKKLVHHVKSDNAFRDKKPSAKQEHKILIY